MKERLRPEDKTIEMPSRDIIIARLNSFLRNSNIVIGSRSFYVNYADHALLPYRKVSAKMLVEEWSGTSESYEEIRKCSPVVAMTLGLSFDAFIKVLVPELADEAIGYKNRRLLRT